MSDEQMSGRDAAPGRCPPAGPDPAWEALRFSEEKFRKVFDASPDAINVNRLHDGMYVSINPGFTKITGYAPAEVVGRTSVELSIWADPGDRARLVEGLRRDGAVRDLEARFVMKDGSVRHGVMSASVIQIAGVPHIVSVTRDVTDRRLLEEERFKAQKLESVGRLAGGIAHDFNNLLQGLFGCLAMARRSLDDPGKTLALLEQAERALHQSVRLTTQLLTFAKGGAPVRATLDLRPVIREATLFALSGSRVDCEFSVDEGLWAVEADERQVALVLHHLVLNAEQAMPGGGRVAVSARNVPSVPDAGPAAGAAGRVVEITVRDGGPGIPAENLPQIFDPYFTTKEKGSGLGLASVYAIVVNHGGTITAASSPGEGATFTVRLPASDRDPRAAAPGEAAQPGRAARILVMDDEEIVRQVAEAMLGEIGHQVTLAADGTAAVARYREALAAGRRFDAVILDLTVRGGVGGLEALQHLLEIDPGVRAAASSGYSDDAAAAEHRRHGFRAFLPKPYTMRGLEAALAELLGD